MTNRNSFIGNAKVPASLSILAFSLMVGCEYEQSSTTEVTLATSGQSDSLNGDGARVGEVVQPLDGSQLEFSVPPPPQTQSGFMVEVIAAGANGEVDTTYTGTATLSLENAGTASLLGTTELRFVAGVAASDLVVDIPGVDYVLRVSNNDLGVRDSPPFEVKGIPRWVDSRAGGDDKLCADRSAPCKTVSVAIAAAQCWDTILLNGAQVHPGPVILRNKHCKPGEDLVVKAWPNTGVPEIRSTISGGGRGYALRVWNASNVTIDGLRLTSEHFNGLEITRVSGGTVRNSIIENAGYYGIIIGTSSDILVENNIAGNNAGRILGIGANNGEIAFVGNQLHNGEVLVVGPTSGRLLFERNRLTNAIIQIRDSGSIFRNNIFENTRNCLRVRASNLLIENNTFYNATGSCVVLDAAGSGNVIRNNIFAEIGGYAIYNITNNNVPLVVYNAFSNVEELCRKLPPGQCDNEQNNNLHLEDADPLFADTTNDDGSLTYYLHTNSPLIDAGDPASNFANEPAPNGGRINLGAWGNTPQASPTDPNALEIVVDDDDPENFVTHLPSHIRTNNQSVSYHAIPWTNPERFSITSADQRIGGAMWTTNLPRSGNYKVSVYIPRPSPPHASLYPVAEYSVRDAEGATIVYANQKRSAGEWVELGVFPFLASKPAAITLTTQFRRDREEAIPIRLHGDLLADRVRFSYQSPYIVLRDETFSIIGDSSTTRSSDLLITKNFATHPGDFRITDVTQGLSGRVSFDDAAKRKIRYAPNPGFVGTDTFAYLVEHESGATWLNITVNVLAPPVLAEDSLCVDRRAKHVRGKFAAVDPRFTILGRTIVWSDIIYTQGEAELSPDPETPFQIDALFADDQDIIVHPKWFYGRSEGEFRISRRESGPWATDSACQGETETVGSD